MRFLTRAERQVCAGAGSRTWGDLGCLDDIELMRTTSIGALTVKRIHEALQEYGPHVLQALSEAPPSGGSDPDENRVVYLTSDRPMEAQIPLARRHPWINAAAGMSIDHWELFDTRAAGALLRERIVTWGELGRLDDVALLEFENVGVLTVDHIHRVLQKLAPYTVHAASKNEQRDTSDPTDTRIYLAAGRPLTAAAHWGAAIAEDVSIGELLDACHNTESVPADVVEDIEVQRSTPFGLLAGTDVPSLKVLMTTLQEQTGDLGLFIARLCETPKPSYAMLGHRRGITGEAARRQIMRDAASIQRCVRQPRFAAIRWAMQELQEQIGLVSSAQGAVVQRWRARLGDPGFELLRWAAGYVSHEGWVTTENAHEQLTEAIRTVAQQQWLVHSDDLFAELGEPPDRGTVLSFLQGHEPWKDIGEGWLARWDGTLIDKAVKVLHLTGRPMTAAELAAAVGEGTDNRFKENGGALVRVDKQFRLALPEWGHEPYRGIPEAIKEAISRGGGVASRSVLLDEIPERYGVKASSVTSYLDLAIFDTDGDSVRLRAGPLFDPKPPDTIPGATRTTKGWGQWHTISELTMKGYSFQCNQHIAWANGIRPGDTLRVPLNRSGRHKASIIWRLTSLTRAVEIGRLRLWIQQRGLTPGQRLLICPTPEDVTVRVEAPPSKAQTRDETVN